MNRGGCSADGEPIYFGKVKSYHPEAGWGHIECEPTQQIYGKDMFFHANSILTGVVSRGATARFTVIQGTKGPEASKVSILTLNDGSDGGGTQTQVSAVRQGLAEEVPGPTDMIQQGFTEELPGPEHELPTTEAPQPEMADQAKTGVAANGPGEHTFVGAVKNYTDMKGWGHIACDQTHKIYGKDVYFFRASLRGGVMSGDIVQFTVREGFKGPEATSVTRLQPGNQRNGGSCGGDEKVYHGTVIMWNPDKGWGFVGNAETTQLFGRDIFLHKNHLGGYTPSEGEPVQFSVHFTGQGRPEATAIFFTNVGYGPARSIQGMPGRPGPW